MKIAIDRFDSNEIWIYICVLCLTFNFLSHLRDFIHILAFDRSSLRKIIMEKKNMEYANGAN